jgi:hypothetical protein
MKSIFSRVRKMLPPKTHLKFHDISTTKPKNKIKRNKEKMRRAHDVTTQDGEYHAPSSCAAFFFSFLLFFNGKREIKRPRWLDG